MSPVAMAVALTLISLSTKSKAADQTWDGGSGSGSAWLTGTNWVGDPADANVPGSKTVTANIDIASFGATGSAATIGINMSFSGNTFYLGAINLTTGSRNIGDSSSTAGTLKLDGATVNSVANVILRNTNSGTLTVLGTSTGTMGLALGNTTDNVVSIDGAGGIAVSSIISGAAKHLTLGGVGTGILTLSAANTYSGGTTVAAGNLRVTNTSGSATGTLGVTVANNTGVAQLQQRDERLAVGALRVERLCVREHNDVVVGVHGKIVEHSAARGIPVTEVDGQVVEVRERRLGDISKHGDG